MNKRQRIATFSALGLFLLTIIFAPWQRAGSSGHLLPGMEYGFILSPPASGYSVRLAVAPLLTAWAAIAILYGGTLLLLSGEKHKNVEQQQTSPLDRKLKRYRVGFWSLLGFSCLASIASLVLITFIFAHWQSVHRSSGSQKEFTDAEVFGRTPPPTTGAANEPTWENTTPAPPPGFVLDVPRKDFAKPLAPDFSDRAVAPMDFSDRAVQAPSNAPSSPKPK